METTNNGIQYDTDTATLIASSGKYYECNGRNMDVYKTPDGHYFLHVATIRQNEHDYILPMGYSNAKIMYEDLPIQMVEI